MVAMLVSLISLYLCKVQAVKNIVIWRVLKLILAVIPDCRDIFDQIDECSIEPCIGLTILLFIYTAMCVTKGSNMG